MAAGKLRDDNLCKY